MPVVEVCTIRHDAPSRGHNCVSTSDVFVVGAMITKDMFGVVDTGGL